MKLAPFKPKQSTSKIFDTKMKVLFFLAAIVSVAFTEAVPFESDLLLPHAGSVNGRNCLSWRLAVETNNVRDWDVVPADCAYYVADYMSRSQYPADCNYVTSAAYKHARSIQLKEDGKDVWVFDIGESSLSNLPYYSRSDVLFG